MIYLIEILVDALSGTGIILRDQKELQLFALGSMMIALRKLRLLHLIDLRKLLNMLEEKTPSFTLLSLKVLIMEKSIRTSVTDQIHMGSILVWMSHLLHFILIGKAIIILMEI